MRRRFLLGVLILGVLLLAGLGASLSLVRSATSRLRARTPRARSATAPSLAFERSTTR